MIRHKVVSLIVERGWPFSIGIYALFAAIACLRGDSSLVELYAFESPHFAAGIYIAAAVTVVPLLVWPRHHKLRWVFFVVSGFMMTGRLLQIPDHVVTSISISRGAFVLAALLAHLVIQVDWLIESGRDRR